MNTDGNTDAINRHIDELEAHFDKQDAETELQDLRDEVDALTAKLSWVLVERDETFALMLDRAQTAETKLAEVTAERDRWRDSSNNMTQTYDRRGRLLDQEKSRAEKAEAMLPRAYRAGVEAGAKRAHAYLAESKLPLEQRSECAHLGLYDAILALPTPTIERLNDQERKLE